MERQHKGSGSREYKSRLFSFIFGVVLSLSDAFKEEIRQNVMRRYNENKEKPNDVMISAEVERIFQEANPDIEVRVRMVNINYGHNKEILSACKPLKEYAWFVAQVRKNLEAGRNNGEDQLIGIDNAIDKTIDDMPEDFEIKKFITDNRAEVKDMCLTEYDEEGKVLGAIDILRSLGHSAEEIKTIIMRSYNLSEEKTNEYL